MPTFKSAESETDYKSAEAANTNYYQLNPSTNFLSKQPEHVEQ